MSVKCCLKGICLLQGKWRRLIVDDRLPLGEFGEMLLPISQPHNLWLPLLTKALLRIAAVSQTKEVNVIHCLTGWLHTTVPCKGVSKLHLWPVCCELMCTTDGMIHSPDCCDEDCLKDLSVASSRVILADVSVSV